jgi:hypothetical protein
MNFRNLLTRRRLFIILICGAVGGYSGWVASHRPEHVNTVPVPKELTQKLLRELVKLRDNIDGGITRDELNTRAAAIRDTHLNMFLYNYDSIPKPTQNYAMS